MRIGFAGTPAFAAAALKAILDAGLPIAVALTQPDRPRDRGWQPKPGPVKTLADARGIQVLQPSSLKSEAECAPIVAIPLDILVVVAYGLILPPSMLEWPREGCINIHASLLPRWRGAAPIQRALLAGDRGTGITLMWMDEGLDTGPIIARHPVPIAARETAGTLHGKLAAGALGRTGRGHPCRHRRDRRRVRPGRAQRDAIAASRRQADARGSVPCRTSACDRHASERHEWLNQLRPSQSKDLSADRGAENVEKTSNAWQLVQDRAFDGCDHGAFWHGRRSAGRRAGHAAGPR